MFRIIINTLHHFTSYQLFLCLLHKILQTKINFYQGYIFRVVVYEIENSSAGLEESIRILNLASNEMGFMSSFYKEDESTYSIMSRNCIVHKVAFSIQDVICHGFHDRIIQKALEGKLNPEVRLKECIALGDNYSRHTISMNKNTDKTSF
jgi:hypothetical protein